MGVSKEPLGDLSASVEAMAAIVAAFLFSNSIFSPPCQAGRAAVILACESRFELNREKTS